MRAAQLLGFLLCLFGPEAESYAAWGGTSLSRRVSNVITSSLFSFKIRGVFQKLSKIISKLGDYHRLIIESRDFGNFPPPTFSLSTFQKESESVVGLCTCAVLMVDLG